jgi:hypothetical protein
MDARNALTDFSRDLLLRDVGGALLNVEPDKTAGVSLIDARVRLSD